MTQSGIGTTILTGANTYSGTTTIDVGGTLLIGSGGALVFGSTTETGGGGAAGFASAAMGSTGSLRVAGGTLRVDSNAFGALLQDFSSATIDSGATLNLNERSGSSSTIANLQGSGTLTNTAQIMVLSGNFAGAITGSADLFKAGGGTLVLSGTNTYSGPTTIANGTLQIGAGGTTGTLGSGNVAVGSTLSFNRSDSALTVTNAISGPSRVTTLTGALSYTGGTFVDAGRLVLGDALNAVTLPGNAAIGSATSLVLANDSLGNTTITNDGNLEIQGTATAGSASINNAGLVRFMGNATGGTAAYTGQSGNSTMDFSSMDASGATLGSLAGTGAVNLGSIALQAGGNHTSTPLPAGSPMAAAVAGLTKSGAGNLTLTGDSSGFAGSTQVAAGTLSVNGNLGGNLTVASGATLGGSARSAAM